MKYIELNMTNYDEEDVSQLNQWAIAAFTAIESIVGEAAFSGLPESKQESLLSLIEVPEKPETLIHNFFHNQFTEE